MAETRQKKYYEFTYSYSRYNPQLGTRDCTSTVIASTKAEAAKLAKRACNSAIYGSNYFNEVLSRGPVLVEGKDYVLKTEMIRSPAGHSYRYETVAKKVY